MNDYIKILIPIFAIFLVACGSQRYTGNDRRDNGYGNVLSGDSRYYEDDYSYNSGAGWNELDKVRVAARKEEKRVKVTRREGKEVSQLLFRTDGPIKIQRVVVKYSNGNTEELNVRNSRFDRRNRNSDLNEDLIVRVPDYGRARLREINFWYDVNKRSIFSKRPTVTVFAR